MFEREEGLRSNLVAKFKLCPNESCGTCRNGGEYIVEMREFVETYQNALQESREYECQSAQESCEYSCQNGGNQYQNYNGNGQNYNGNGEANNYQNGNNGNYNNNNEDYCLNSCLADKGLSYCIEEEGQEQQDLNEFAECQPLGERDGEQNNGYNYNSNYQQYYVGAYCTGSGVYAGVFTDSTCTKHAPKGTYEKYNYGYSLPTEPLVSSTCLSCAANNYQENNNYNGENNNGNNYNYNGNNNNNQGISEVCEQLYEESVKCEKHVNAQYKDTSGCDMIHHVIPQLSKAMNNIRGPNFTAVFAWVFGIGFFALAGYLYKLHKKAGKDTSTGYTLE